MKITKSQLKQIIKEELESVVRETAVTPKPKVITKTKPEDLKKLLNPMRVALTTPPGWMRKLVNAYIDLTMRDKPEVAKQLPTLIQQATTASEALYNAIQPLSKSPGLKQALGGDPLNEISSLIQSAKKLKDEIASIPTTTEITIKGTKLTGDQARRAIAVGAGNTHYSIINSYNYIHDEIAGQ